MSTRPLCGRQRGSAPTDVLVGALVVLILFAAASPFYRAAERQADLQQCHQRRLLMAKANGRFREASPAGAFTTNVQDLKEIVHVSARCPRGAPYAMRVTGPGERDHRGSRIPEGVLVVGCSVETHEPVYLNPR